MVNGLFFCATLTGRNGGHTPFGQAGAETPDTGAEEDPRCSWKGHSGRVGASIVDGNTESRKVVQPLCLTLVNRPGRRTSVIVVR